MSPLSNPACAKTPPTSDHPIIGDTTQPEEGVCIRKFDRIDIVLEPAQRPPARFRHGPVASAARVLPPAVLRLGQPTAVPNEKSVCSGFPKVLKAVRERDDWSALND